MQAGNNKVIVRPPSNPRTDKKVTQTGFEYFTSTIETGADGRNVYNENKVVNTLCTVVALGVRVSGRESFISEDSVSKNSRVLRFNELYSYENFGPRQGDEVYVRYDQLLERANWFLSDEGEWLVSVDMDSILGFRYAVQGHFVFATQGRVIIKPMKEEEDLSKVESIVANSKIIIPQNLKKAIKDNYVGVVQSAGRHFEEHKGAKLSEGDVVVYFNKAEVALFPDYEDEGNVDLVVAYNPMDILCVIKRETYEL